MVQRLKFLFLSDLKNILPMLRKAPALWWLLPKAQPGVGLGPGERLQRDWRGVAQAAGPWGMEQLVHSVYSKDKGGLWSRDDPSLWKVW